MPASPAGILGVLLHALFDGFLIGDLGQHHVGLHLILREQAVHNDLQVKFAIPAMMVWPVSSSV